MNSNDYISVSDLNAYIKTYLEGNYFLNDLYIKGEVTGFKKHSSGTLYFQIKDENSRVNIIMFNYLARNLKVSIKDGDMVLIKGKISLYEATGQYSIVCSELLFDSIGMLYIEYERLKKQLEEEGLFDDSHKVEIPLFPKRIGVVTALTGAAIHDIVKTLFSRFDLANIYVFPCLVQGKDASKDIIRALKQADDYNLDVIICGRGGGSIEDLWCFNDESLARFVYQMKTPIISAVGHQVDFTIIDFVSDLRALTPTDGAIKATPKKEDLIENLESYKNYLINSMNNIIDYKKKQLEIYSNNYLLKNPLKYYEEASYRIDNLNSKLIMFIKKYISEYKNKLDILKTKLELFNPQTIFSKGYSMTLNENNKIIKSINDVNVDESLNIKVKDGTIKAIVKEKF